MKDIVYTQDNKIFLNSNLTEESFAKTKFSNLLGEKGLIFSKTGEHFTSVEYWTFDSTKSIEDSVYFTKTGFSGKTLETIIIEENDDFNEALFCTVKAISYAQKKGFSVPCNGPAGILYNENQILFLPEKTFSSCAQHLEKSVYQKMQNIWVDSAASCLKAENFMQGVLIYYSLTKKVPFPLDSEEQSVNIADKKFLPLKYCINGISTELSDFVDKSLKGENIISPLPKEIYKKELFESQNRKPSMNETEFSKSVEKFIRFQNAKISSKRKIRRHYIQIALIAVAAVFIFLCVALIKYENSKKPSVVGLTSQTVTEIFYSGIHKLNADYMKVSAKDCPQASYYISTIPQIRVVSLMPGAYNLESGLSSPENWFFFEPDTTKSYSHQIYGITNFKIDQKDSTLNLKVPKKSQRKLKLINQDGKRLKNLDEKTHFVEYYLVHTVNNRMEVDFYQTSVNLIFQKDKWQISELDQKWQTEFYDWAEVSKDFKTELEKNQNDVIKSVQNLKQKYPWVPTKESLEEEQKYLDSLGY